MHPIRQAAPLAIIAILSAACREAPPPTAPAVAIPTVPALAKQRDPESGALDLCKVGGDGVVAGTAFTFRVAQSGVTRYATVAAGSCASLEVPRERSPLGKGHYLLNPGELTRFVPAGATLVIDGVELTSDQLLAILQSSPDVQASSVLLLNLAQQLIAADLNVLRGVQASSEAAQAIADANAAIQIAVGATLQITTALSTSGMSALVDVLTAYNEGKPKPPTPPTTVDLHIVETVDALAELIAIGCNPSTRCTGTDLATASVTATVAVEATTTVTFTNRGRPVLRACKVAGPGVTPGTSFGIVAFNTSTTENVDVPAGECRDVVLPEGSYQVAEPSPGTGLILSAIACEPAGRCSNANLTAGAVNVSIVRGITTVTFTNRSIVGTLRVCKVAGAGITPGTVFGISAGGINIVGAPGAPATASYQVPAGECREANVHEGTYQVAEPAPGVGVVISSITCEPADRCGEPSLTVGAVNADVPGASTTTVTFTNRKRLGTLEVCKVGGPGIAAGTVFRIGATELGLNTNTTNYDVPVGECRSETVNAGSFILQEVIPAGVAVSAISCEPTNACGTPIVRDGVVALSLPDQGTVKVTYTNRSTLGTLRVCKVAGTGVTPGTVFTIGAAGVGLNSGSVRFEIPAGECREAIVEEGPYIVQESIPAGMQVTSIVCDPACPNPLLQDGVVTLFLQAQTTVVVTYTNAVAAAMLLPVERDGSLARRYALHVRRERRAFVPTPS